MRQLIRLVLILVLTLVPVAVAYADGGTHIVQPGETLFRIALNHGISVEALRAANGIVGNTIYAGQTLTIPGSNTSANLQSPVASPPVVASPGTHIVQAGENLFRIGLKYGLSWQTIQAANNLPSPNVYAGQTLIIPGGSVASVPVADPLLAVSAPTPVEAATASEAASSPPIAPTGLGKRFLVDLSEQRVYAYEGDTLVRSTLASTGRWPTTTVIGTFYIYLKYTSQRMVGPGYNLPGVPYVMYFYQSYALHGTYWHNNFGTPMSHGCVNLPTSEAEWAFNWAPLGTPVTVQP